MFEALKTIGETASGVEMEEFIKPVKKEGLLCRVIFDFDRGSLDCDCDIACDEKRALEYLWVGNSEGNRPQLRLTTDRVEYLLNPKQAKGRKWSIQQIPERVGEIQQLQTNSIKALCDVLEEIRESFFANAKERVSEFSKILQKKGIDSKNIALYTIAIKRNGKIQDLVKEAGYREFLKYDLELGTTDRYEMVDGTCHICGEKKRVLTNPDYPKGTPLITYNVDKAGFFSDLSRSPEAMKKTYTVCPECRKKILRGYKFVEQHMKTRLADLDVYITFRVVGVQLDPRLLDGLKNLTNGAYHHVAEYSTFDKIDETFREYQRWMSGAPSTYSINLLFGHRGRQPSEFVFRKMIQDVPVTRFFEIATKASELEQSISEVFGEETSKWSIRATDMCKIFPERRSFIELFSAMLGKAPYSQQRIVGEALLYAKILRHRTEVAHGLATIPENQRESQMCRALLKYAMFLRLLEKIGVNRGAESKKLCIPVIDQETKRFIESQNFQEWQAGLFLLGNLIGWIGIEQYKRGDKRKSILDKINFDGCSLEKVKSLANTVLEGLKNYRILTQHEGVYAAMKEILDRNLTHLTNPIDNTYFILSGYAFITQKAITSGKNERSSQ
jgi:CRISPR-associated protein Csh1